MKKDRKIFNYDQPKYIYLPYDSKDSIKLPSDGNVLVSTEICTYNGKTITSSVSGRILGSSNVFVNNKPTSAIAIENDFRDLKREVVKSKSFFDYGKNDIKNILKENKLEKSKMDPIVLEIKCEKNYDESDYLLVKEYAHDILDTLDKIAYGYSIKNIYIIINKKDKAVKREFMNYIGTYLNINLVKKLKIEHSSFNVEEIVNLNNIFKIKSRSRYIYLTINNKGTVYLVKTKKYVTLKELLIAMNITSNNIYDINKNKLNELEVLNSEIRTIIVK